MSEGDLSLLDLFREEARAHTATLSQGLVELESDATNSQRIEPLMRAAHSLKGAARIVSLEAAVRLAHVMEDVLVAAQHGRIRIGPDEIDILLQGTDILAGLATDDLSAWSAQRESAIAALERQLRAIAKGEGAAQQWTEAPSEKPEVVASKPVTVAAPARAATPIPRDRVFLEAPGSMFDMFREEVRVHALALSDGLASLEQGNAVAEHLEGLARAAHTIRGAARIVNLDSLAQLSSAIEDLFIKAHQQAAVPDATVLPALRQALSLLAELLQVNEDGIAEWDKSHHSEFAQVITQFGKAVQEVPVAAPKLPAEPIGEPPNVRKEAAAAPAIADLRSPEAASAEPAETVVRVTAQSLNRLMGLAGESLVQARWLQPFSTALLKLKKHQDHLAGLLERLAQTVAQDSTARAADQLDRWVAEAQGQANLCRQVLAERVGEFEDHAAMAEDLNSRLYREVIVSRMRPFGDGTHGFLRLVRDMARKLDKQVRLELDGEATEVDRDVLEKLEAPLTHLIRNAVDHGIEPPAQRRAAGKSEAGVIRVLAQHRAGTLAITVSDDGGGIDVERIRKKVVERGLTTAEMAQTLGGPELLEFLFLPNFSTAQALTEYSGRGVGLDVVQTTMRTIGGRARISSRLGQGTTFHLQLPITLSVIRAVLVDIAGEPYAFPHNRIDRLIRVPRSEIRSLERRQFVNVDGQNVGLVLAAQLLGLAGEAPAPDPLPILLLSDQTGLYGLIIERFRGEHDLVVRPLDCRLGKVPDVSAAAILDDGSPVLIVDVEDLIRSMDQFIQTGSLERCARSESAQARKKRVLVVDDSITVREVERQLLRHHGYEVAVAVDGQDGWKAVQAERFDLVITDVDMPRMNGLDLVRAIRQNQHLKELPVVVVSYKDREDDRLAGLEAGANYYLTKSSFHDATFLQAVTDLIGEAS
jgi:two-component system sensor histidine kinase and response regulator WspE